jgi:hypothetical protein
MCALIASMYEVSGKREEAFHPFALFLPTPSCLTGKRAVYGETYAHFFSAAHSLFRVWIIDGAGILLFCVLSSSLSSFALAASASRMRNISRFFLLCVCLSLPFAFSPHKIMQGKYADRRKFRLLLCLSAERFSIRPADHKIYFQHFKTSPASSGRPRICKQEMKKINETFHPRKFLPRDILISFIAKRGILQNIFGLSF